MLSDNSDDISQEARRLLADQYDSDGKHWFAFDIRTGRSKQFDGALKIITRTLKQRYVPDCRCGNCDICGYYEDDIDD